MENLQTFLTLEKAGFFGGILFALYFYRAYMRKPKKEAKEPHIRCSECIDIKGVIETAEKNNELLKEVLAQVKKNNKLQQLQLLKGVEQNELQRIVSIIEGE